MIAPFLGGDDPIFGTAFTSAYTNPLEEFFAKAKLGKIRSSLSSQPGQVPFFL